MHYRLYKKTYLGHRYVDITLAVCYYQEKLIRFFYDYVADDSYRFPEYHYTTPHYEDILTIKHKPFIL